MKTLTIILLALSTLISCNSTGSKSESINQNTAQTTAPNYEVALHFINEYLNYSKDRNSQITIPEWVNNRSDVTIGFKTELNKILTEAQKQDPELGLGFDPILDAQDSPNEFEIDKTDSEYLIVKGVKWNNFQLTMKLKQEGDSWRVDGSGIINIPKNKKIKR